MTEGDAGSQPEVEPEPSIEDVHQLAIRTARAYSPRCPAEDIAQDVAERWLRKDPKPEMWRGWVATVTRNRIRDVMGRAPAAKDLLVAPDVSDEYLILGGAIYGPSARVIARDQLRKMLGGLPPAECRVLVASLEGLTNAEIAEEFDYASTAVVSTVLAKAKARIRAANPHVDLAITPQRLYDV